MQPLFKPLRLEGSTERRSFSSWWRVPAFIASCALVVGAWNLWRPPGPMLGLEHREHMSNMERYARTVSLNFDDAPHPVITPLLLASLKRANVKASFFVIGDGLQRYPELARRILLDGHALANHSQNHHNLSTVPREAFDVEIMTAFKTIESTLRQNGMSGTTRLFRPPGGGLDRDVMHFLWKNNVKLAWWSNNVGDWARPPGWKIVGGVTARLQPGDIILLHDAPGGYGTPQALPAIVRAARKQGLEFVPMPED